MLDGAKAFCGELEKSLETHSLTPSAVFNYDETRVTMRGGKLAVKRVQDASKIQTNTVSTRTSIVTTLLSFICASGAVFMSVYVMKANFGDVSSAPVDFRLESAPRVSRHCHPTYYCWPDTGFLNADSFQAVMDKITEEWTARNPDLPRYCSGSNWGPTASPKASNGHWDVASTSSSF